MAYELVLYFILGVFIMVLPITNITFTTYLFQPQTYTILDVGHLNVGIVIGLVNNFILYFWITIAHFIQHKGYPSIWASMMFISFLINMILNYSLNDTNHQYYIKHHEDQYTLCYIFNITQFVYCMILLLYKAIYLYKNNNNNNNNINNINNNEERNLLISESVSVFPDLFQPV